MKGFSLHKTTERLPLARQYSLWFLGGNIRLSRNAGFRQQLIPPLFFVIVNT